MGHHGAAVRALGPWSQGCEFELVLWSTQRLSTFMSTQRISRHVDIIFNISTKEQWKNKMSIIMWEAAMSYTTTFEWNIIGSKTLHYNKVRALLCRVFPNYISFTTSLINARSTKIAHFMIMSSLSAHACATYRRTHWCCVQLLASPLTKWNLPVPCNIGRETRCVF